jgi:peroxiredoxin Q/BCP
MGKEFLGIERNTFIIGPDGNIRKVYRGVNPQTHTVEIIKDLKDLQK